MDHPPRPSTASAPGPAENAPESKSRARNEYFGYGFGPDAPSRYLPFPATAKITAVELLAFLPNSIHCADVVYRLITNGATPTQVCAIVNTYRKLPKEWPQASCRQSIYKTMDQGGYKDWRLQTHGSFHRERKSTWDDADLNVAGFSPPSGNVEIPPTDILFKKLAIDLSCMPQGHDALDLTRMVEYCVQNPHEPWFYPRDYDKVLQLVGGAATVRKEHSDGAASQRWAGIKPSLSQDASTSAPLVPVKKKKNAKRKRKTDIEEDLPVSRRQKEAVPPPKGGTPESETEHEMQELRGRPGKSVWFDDEPAVEEFAEEEEEGMEDEDIMASASRDLERTSYAAPPEDSVVPWETALANAQDEDAMDMAFFFERQAGETDAYGPYAFGGPRHKPPYRPLYRIDQPDPSDASGWAENPRWAFEQNTLYRYPHRPDAWNESPEHMELIVKIRIDRYWMSDEFAAMTDD
ncbi:hypothetical protein J4E86_003783 [Alternaria arbusti]|uniref:uncharacterized protein n=1 Tax=Alternaria arbusti TaxID=232088 RepID=UPI00221E7A3E|nr:uncharacterized protein J4E86_003783 [Alternaria arbusti]KAI4958186.1 hypothetical protein J4E86_003783 [Alternaria arbusti]